MRAVMVAASCLALVAGGREASGFVEDVRVLQEWHGSPGGNFGWAVSELEDIDRDGVTDVIVGEPSAGAGRRGCSPGGPAGRCIGSTAWRATRASRSPTPATPTATACTT